MIQYGDADVMVVGGAEAATSPITVAGFASMRALSGAMTNLKKPVGRGTKTETALCWVKALLVLEEYERAKARGAQSTAKYWVLA